MHVLWSPKGGSGTTVCAALVAVATARRRGSCLLVDLGGDLPAMAGLAEPELGLGDWLSARPDAPIDALARLELAVSDRIDLLPLGSTHEWPPERVADLVTLLERDDRPVVVDAGLLDAGGGPAAELRPDRSLARALRSRADRSFACVRPCYLALRRLGRGSPSDAGVIVVVEPGRALDAADVGRVTGLEVRAQVEVDASVARLVDAGLLMARPPRPALRALRGVA